MKKLMLLSGFCVALVFIMGGFYAQPALAEPGDVCGDGGVSTSDVGCLIDYLFNNGPAPPNPIDADVDGSSGINLGDLHQLIGYLFAGCNLMPHTGIGSNISDIEFTLPRIGPGIVGVPFDVPLKLTDNPGPDLMGIVITFSYQHEPDHVGVDLNSVDITGSILPTEWDYIFRVDNINKKALLALKPQSSTDPPLTAGTTGLIATLNFTTTENPAGDPTCLNPVLYPPTNTPLLLTDYCADGTSPVDRVLIPKMGKKGDSTSDGAVSISDVVFLICYMFMGGPCPCPW